MARQSPAARQRALESDPGRTDIGDERLLALLAALDLPPDVLEEEVGSDGDRFSGGQKQRLCLARTLLQGAPRLLLDEPGASLDLRNAERVAALLAGWPGTRVVVTHDPALACRADRVWVLEGGRLTAAGSRMRCARRGLVRPFLPGENDRRSIEKLRQSKKSRRPFC
ncbi:ATP-binding cassette domain-containing protein [Serratia ureilytica]